MKQFVEISRLDLESPREALWDWVYLDLDRFHSELEFDLVPCLTPLERYYAE